MGLQFVPTSPSDHPALLKFLIEVFQTDSGLSSFRSDVWQWKYFSSHPDWNGHRSFVLKKDQEITAHGGIWPVRLAVPGGELRAIHLIDWVASRKALGAGIHILKSISSLADIMLTIGGSSDTNKILPKIGYQRGGILRRYVRVVRPWMQLRTRPQHDWKSPLRFLRNSVSSLNPLPKAPPDWQVSKVSRFDSSVEPISNRNHLVGSLRTEKALNHMLDCPAAQFSGFVVSEAGRLVGYFVLAKIGRQARVVDLRINRAGLNIDRAGVGRSDVPKSEDWRSICIIAARTACQDPQICELVIGTSSREVGEVLEQLGFRLRRQDQILYYDPPKLLNSGTTLGLNLIDSDLSFLCDPAHPYIS